MPFFNPFKLCTPILIEIPKVMASVFQNHQSLQILSFAPSFQS
jgi:hypothetical protein